MIELWGWVSSEIAPQIEAVIAVMAIPSPVQSPGAAADPSTSWLWQFSTGPALGGVLALGAAVLAFIRIGHQVAAARVANTETARKNSEEQWWDTLKWTYTEAKDSMSNSGPFQAVAAVKILGSLKHDQLNVQQKQAIESIMEIFGESEKPEVQEALSPIYRSFDRVSPREYEESVRKMLSYFKPGGVKDHSERALDLDYDFLLQRGEKYVVIDVKATQSALGTSGTAVGAKHLTMIV